jgi:hypothetical protein
VPTLGVSSKIENAVLLEALNLGAARRDPEELLEGTPCVETVERAADRLRGAKEFSPRGPAFVRLDPPVICR